MDSSRANEKRERDDFNLSENPCPRSQPGSHRPFLLKQGHAMSIAGVMTPLATNDNNKTIQRCIGLPLAHYRGGQASTCRCGVVCRYEKIRIGLPVLRDGFSKDQPAI